MHMLLEIKPSKVVELHSFLCDIVGSVFCLPKPVQYVAILTASHRHQCMVGFRFGTRALLQGDQFPVGFSHHAWVECVSV